MTQRQRQMVLDHLRKGQDITSLDALRLYGIGRLAARIRDLREAGHAITTTMVTVPKLDGSTARVASYSLADPALEGFS